jgi:hypothetical protein
MNKTLINCTENFDYLTSNFIINALGTKFQSIIDTDIDVGHIVTFGRNPYCFDNLDEAIAFDIGGCLFETLGFVEAFELVIKHSDDFTSDECLAILKGFGEKEKLYK